MRTLMRKGDEDAEWVMIYHALVEAIWSAERKKGKPVHLLNILTELKRLHASGKVELPPDFVFTCQKMCLYVFDIYRNDEILSDRQMDYFSFNPRN